MKSAVVVFPGVNCEHDVVYALEALGGEAQLVWHRETDLTEFDGIVLQDPARWKQVGNGRRETDPLDTYRADADGRGDAYQAPILIDQRPAARSLRYRGVGLEHSVEDRS